MYVCCRFSKFKCQPVLVIEFYVTKRFNYLISGVVWTLKTAPSCDHYWWLLFAGQFRDFVLTYLVDFLLPKKLKLFCLDGVCCALIAWSAAFIVASRRTVRLPWKKFIVDCGPIKSAIPATPAPLTFTRCKIYRDQWRTQNFFFGGWGRGINFTLNSILAVIACGTVRRNVIMQLWRISIPM